MEEKHARRPLSIRRKSFITLFGDHEPGNVDDKTSLQRKGNLSSVGGRTNLSPQIDHLHYDVIRAKPDGSCSRPAETGSSFPGGKASGQSAVLKRYRVNTENNVARGSHGGNCPWRLV